MPKLTKRYLDALDARSTDYLEFDNEVPCFGVRVMRSGKRSFLVQYRSGGRTRRVTFGRYGTMTPEEARKMARELLVEVGKGGNPSEERIQARRSPTVAAVCDRFMKEHAKQHCKASTQNEYQRSVDLFIKPKIGTHRVRDIVRSDISDLHAELIETPYQANRTLGVLSKLFNLAEVWGYRPEGSNPCRHVRKYRERRRERFLLPAEISRLGAALDEIDRDGSETKSAIAAIRLLVLTGCRLGEIQTLKWSYIRGDAAYLPDSKTGAKKVHLGPEGLAILEKVVTTPGDEYVIAGKKPNSFLTDLQHPWRRIRARASLDDVRIHDLRHSFASQALAQGLGLPTIGRLLGHKSVQSTARYAHLADDPVKLAALSVSAGVARLLRGGKDDDPKDEKVAA